MTSPHVQSITHQTRRSTKALYTKTPPIPSSPKSPRPIQRQHSRGSSFSHANKMNEPPDLQKVAKPRRRIQRGQRKPKKISPESGAAIEGEETEDVEDGEEFQNEDELFGLLGLDKPLVPENEDAPMRKEGVKKGLLNISKEDIESSKVPRRKGPDRRRKDEPAPANNQDDPLNSRQTPKRANSRTPKGQKATPHLSDLPTSTSESDVPPPLTSPVPSPRKTRNKKSSNPPQAYRSAQSGLSSQLSSHLHRPPPHTSHPSDSKAINLPDPTQTTHSQSSGSTFDISALSRSLPSGPSFMPTPMPTKPLYETNDLPISVPLKASGSVPGSTNKKGGRKGRKLGVESENDDARMWDDPYDSIPTANEEMTWQQKLGSYPYADSPSKDPKSKKRQQQPQKSSIPTSFSQASIPNNSSPLNPYSLKVGSRPRHQRRSSADSIPSTYSSHNKHPSLPGGPPVGSSLGHGGNSGPPSTVAPQYPKLPVGGQVQPSLFDTMPPFNPNKNVNRAPQTPTKNGNNNLNQSQNQGKMEFLPIKKEPFPRVGNDIGMLIGGGGGGGGGAYAGAGFHNSPHGRELPKPDMDDF